MRVTRALSLSTCSSVRPSICPYVYLLRRRRLWCVGCVWPYGVWAVSGRMCLQYAREWAVFRDNNPQLMVFYEGLEAWTPWATARLALGL